MSSIKRSLGIAFVLAFACVMIPASISPTGTLEVDGLCATSDCERAPGGFCLKDGSLLHGYRNVVG